MLLHLHRPGPPLDRFVELVTYFEGYEPEHSKERLLPDGAVEIIVDLGERPKRLFDRDDSARSTAFKRAWISGMRRNWIVIEAQPGSSLLVIRFKPGGAFPFLGFAVEGITDIVDQLDTVIGDATASLRDRLLESPTPQAKMAAVEHWLIARAGGALEPNFVIEYLTGRLFAPAGIRIGDVVAEIGYSQRHVLDLCRRWVGLSPKQYGRIRRFQQVLSAVARPHGEEPTEEEMKLRSGPLVEPDWGDLAASHGYCDQSHLVRDFRDFAGMTPSAYARSFRGLENYLPFD